MNRFMPQPGPARGEGTNPYSDANSGFDHVPQLDGPELSPEEKAERAEFQRSLNLINVLSARSIDKERGIFPGVSDDSQLKNVAGKFNTTEEDNATDLPIVVELFAEVNDPKFQVLQIFLTDLRWHAGRDLTQLRETGASQPVSIRIYGNKAELVFKMTAQQNLNIGESEKLGGEISQITDHAQRMAKLRELYEVISGVNATTDTPIRFRLRKEATSEPESEAESE